MEKCYTDLKLIRFLYKDSGIAEYFETQNWIEEDPSVARRFKDLKASFKALPAVKFSPTIQSMNRILAYSKDISFSLS